MRTLKIIAFILVVIGAINWGLVGLFKFDLVAVLFGDMTYFARVIYTLIGLSGIYSLLTLYYLLADEY